jgi:hypothetical protein
VAVSFIGEETGVPGEDHWPVANRWQTLSHNVASSIPHHERDSNNWLPRDNWSIVESAVKHHQTNNIVSSWINLHKNNMSLLYMLYKLSWCLSVMYTLTEFWCTGHVISLILRTVWRNPYVYSIFSFICMFCRSLFVPLYFFCWPLCCLSFFDLRILITPLISSNSSQQYDEAPLLDDLCFLFRPSPEGWTVPIPLVAPALH